MLSIIKKRSFDYRFALLAVCLPMMAASVHAEEEGDDQAASLGHWYIGGSTGYLKPDGNRNGGNTRSIGVQGGYQFNDRWSAEIGFQRDSGAPGKYDLNMHDLNIVRHWGNEYRFLVEFGYTHISLGSPVADGATAGLHVGAGISAFITDNLELRGDAKFVHADNGNRNDGVGTVSLNWHFVPAAAAPQEEKAVLGESNTTESLPETTYREPVAAEEPAEVQQPVPVVVAPAPVASTMPAPTAVPKAVHTLINFDFNSTDVNAKYGTQLDEISAEIKGGNSKAVIEGHTDSKGSSQSNKVLSSDRAIVVKRELKKRGVKGEDLYTVGQGEEHPVASNDTEEGRAQNRRVEVKVYDKQQ